MAAFDFPTSPAIGQAYGNYIWDGEKWTLPNLVDAVAARKSIYAAPFDAMAYSGMQINGGMEVHQTGTGAAASGQQAADGWTLYVQGSAVVNLNSYAAAGVFPAGFPKCLSLIPTTAAASMAAGDFVAIAQRIEGYRVARLGWGTANAQPLTIAFWCRHTKAGLYSIGIRNSGASRSYVATYTQTVGDAVEYKVITVPGDTTGTWLKDNGIGIDLWFMTACGTTYTAPAANTWYAGSYIAAPGQVNSVDSTLNATRLTGVVVLPGIEAPSAERSPLIMRPYTDELLTCQRYYWKSFPQGTSPASGTGYNGSLLAGCIGTDAWGTQMIAEFPCTMRATPTIMLYNPGAAGTLPWNAGISVTCGASSVRENSTRRLVVTGQGVNTAAANLGQSICIHAVADARL